MNGKKEKFGVKSLIIIVVILIIATGIFYYQYVILEQRKVEMNEKIKQAEPIIDCSFQCQNSSDYNKCLAGCVNKDEEKPADEPEQTQDVVSKLSLPIAEFNQRITKKPFGIYITPQTSPVQPERFTGYHTGVDVEYEDVIDDVWVYAITDGVVEESRIVSGYGGLVAIRHDDGRLSLYGHLDPRSIVEKGESVITGQQIGILGDSYTTETDGERKHLHFAVYKRGNTNLKGYVQNKDQLIDWFDPEIILSDL